MNWLIAHLVGDYLLQNDWMAIGKKKSSLPCFVHVALYTATVALFTRWPWWALAIVAATHFAQDRADLVLRWMRLAGQRRFSEPPLAPWSVIVVDNVWHLVVLFGLSVAVAT